MYNYYESNNINHKTSRSQRKLPNTGYVHNYKLLPSNDAISKRDSRRNSLPKYEATWNNVRSNSSDMKKSTRYDYGRQTQHPYNGNPETMRSPSPSMSLKHTLTSNATITNNNNNINNINNNNSSNNSYKNIGRTYQYAMAKQLKEQQLQDKTAHNLSVVEKRTIEDRATLAAFDKHYQHYYSYFYNPPEDFANNGISPHVNRHIIKNIDNSVLYLNKTMATAATTTYDESDDIEVNPRLVNSIQQKLQQHHHHHHHSHKNDDNVSALIHQKPKSQNRQQVLKEKLPNNNVIVTINNQDWLIEPHGERTRVLNLSRNPYGYDNDNEKDDNGQKSLATGNINNNNNNNNINHNNNNNFNKKVHVHGDEKQLRDNSNSTEASDTPKRQSPSIVKPRKVISRTSISSQRSSPNRRVLMYSCPSPRIGRLSPAAVQAARARFIQRERGGGGAGGVNKTATDVYTTSPLRLKNRLLNSNLNGDDTYAADDILNNNEDEAFSDASVNDDDDNESDVKDEDDVSTDSEDGYRNYAFKFTHAMMRDSTTQSCLSLQSAEPKIPPENLLVPSLFPHVPPYLAFSTDVQRGPTIPPELFRILKWRVTNVMPKVVRTILSNSGMRLLKKTNDWMGTWGKHMKSPGFKTLRPYQKLNHLPGSFRIGRKDSCWKNLQKLMNRHSQRDFGFMPKTYIIPQDLPALRKSWSRYVARDVKWIIKPPASARGAGIRVINKWTQIPKRRPLIVQKYIERPLLINGSKFDLRLYVLVTSINPLRVFMYHNGLARFASVKYSEKSETLNDRCMHLTNYSINKISNNYLKNEDVNACHGHKWTIKSLWQYLASRGIRTDLLWETLRSLVLRTLMAGECAMNNMIKMNVESKYSVYELFGFDILLDADLIPWLLEVNISPSLHSELPLDAHVKAPLVQAVLNTALYNIPPKLSLERQREIAAALSYPPTAPFCYDKRLYINYLSREERVKHALYTRKDLTERKDYLNAILNDLTPDDVRCLIVAEDELARCSPLERIFPTSQTHKFLKFTESARYYNRLLDAWETRYGNNRAEGIALLRRFCEQKYHLEVPVTPAKKDPDEFDAPHTGKFHQSVELHPQEEISATDC